MTMFTPNCLFHAGIYSNSIAMFTCMTPMKPDVPKCFTSPEQNRDLWTNYHYNFPSMWNNWYTQLNVNLTRGALINYKNYI